MELYTLGPDFQPLNIVENYSSLIWTERYSKNGDFQISSSEIGHLTSLLPRETYVTLRDSTVPMIVETHKLVKPLRAKPEVVITGRSLETVLDRRGSVNQLLPSTIRTAWMIDAVKESDAAYLAMRIVLGDIARTQGSTTVLPVTPAAVDPVRDPIPELNLVLPADYVDIIIAGVWNSATAYTTGQQVRYIGFVWQAARNNTNVPPSSSVPADWTKLYAWQSYEIKPQNLYTTVVELINASRRGIKAVRPISGESQVDIEIYNGANLTGEGDTGDPNNVVVIDARFDQIDNATYLLSQQGSTNIGYVYGANGAQVVYKNTYADPGDEPSGLQRRVLILDESSDSTTTTTDIRKTRGLIELYKYNATAFFDGEVAKQIAAGYNRDYFLGDILKLVGELGLEQNVRVAEFIRTEDSSGEKAFPTFEAVDD